MTRKSLKELMEDGATVSGSFATTNNGFASGGIGTMIRRVDKPSKKRKSLKDRMDESLLKEFAPPDSGDGGDDGFSEETLKMLAAQWYNGDEDPKIERTLMAAGWEIGQDEGYDDEPGVFVVQAGDVNGNSYLSWPASELKEGMAEDRHPNDKPYGPEFKPTMPKGTVRVDVSDVYDWYKLGKNIANLKGLDSKDFGKGPPSTIVSFGDEDTEHKYINDLENLDLTTTDIDPLDPKQPKGIKRQKVDPTFNVGEARRANSAKARAELSKRDKKVDPIEQEKRKKEEDEAWALLQQHMSKKQDVEEASSPAQQAAIAIAKKKKKQKVDEMDKSAPQPGRDGHVSHSTYGRRDDYNLGDPETTLGPEHILKKHDAIKQALAVLDKSIKQYKDKKQKVNELDTNPTKPPAPKKSWLDYGMPEKDEKEPEQRFHGWDEYEEQKKKEQTKEAVELNLDDPIDALELHLQQLTEAPIEIDRDDPTNPMIYGHNKANPAKLQYRMMRAAGQLKDLAERVNKAQDAESLLMWQGIVANFKELAMNIDQIGHALEELEQTRRKGGVNSRGIPDLS